MPIQVFCSLSRSRDFLDCPTVIAVSPAAWGRADSPSTTVESCVRREVEVANAVCPSPGGHSQGFRFLLDFGDVECSKGFEEPGRVRPGWQGLVRRPLLSPSHPSEVCCYLC